jgi:hypothetical protein
MRTIEAVPLAVGLTLAGTGTTRPPASRRGTDAREERP